MAKKALIAMSGGVDSSVAAYLMKKNGYDCMGVTMRLFDSEDDGGENSCCSLSDVEDARSVARRLGMPYHVFNFKDGFRENVIDRFVCAYENGMTPNPCIDCNRYMKFEKLYLRARELYCDFIATGHYAKIEKDGDRFLLKKAADASKDQSYVLYSLTQSQLAHTHFPLGGYTKSEVREIAAENGFVNAAKHDSQDICFVTGRSYSDFIREYTKKEYPEGDFRDVSGNVLGRHRGIICYTVGQRKGLGIPSSEPLYVKSVEKDDNSVILARNSELFSDSLTANRINLIAVDKIERPIKVKAKIRYRHEEKSAVCEQTGDDEIFLRFDEPQRAITKGQAVVLYDGDTVIGGGTISKAGRE